MLDHATRLEVLETDLATALALARASTLALLNLSALSHREVSAAMQDELARLELESDSTSEAASALLRQFIPEDENEGRPCHPRFRSMR